MKLPSYFKSAPDTHAALEPVQFEFRYASGSAVSIAGSFNGWQPSASPMHEVGPGRWRTKIPLPHGRHEYRIVVDGVWMPDPTSSITVANPYGGLNSIVVVPTTQQALPDRDATPLVLQTGKPIAL